MANQSLTFGERMADRVTLGLGSWTFIILQSMLILLWLIMNVTAIHKPFDPFPFILLNLMLSFQAAYAAPIIMISQNRLATVDRQIAKKDLDISFTMQEEVERILASLATTTTLLQKLIEKEIQDT